MKGKKHDLKLLSKLILNSLSLFLRIHQKGLKKIFFPLSFFKTTSFSQEIFKSPRFDPKENAFWKSHPDIASGKPTMEIIAKPQTSNELKIIIFQFGKSVST